MKAKKLLELDNPAPEIPRKVLAQEIVSISASLKRLLDSGLTERAVICLIQDQCPDLGKGAIRDVLGSLESLADTYTTL